MSSEPAGAHGLFAAIRPTRADKSGELLGLMGDETPRKKIKKAKRPRQKHEFERTPPEGSRAFIAAEIDRLKRFPLIWEGAAGDGAITRELEAVGLSVVSSDLVDRGMGATIKDFYDFKRRLAPAMVTNPPYSEVNWANGKGRWITHAMEELGLEYMALLLSWSWPGAAGLDRIWGRYPPARVYLMRFRLDFSGAGSPPQLNAWFVWERGFQGNPELIMLDHADARQIEWNME